MEYKECYQKIYASWLGKLIGIRLGAPIENWLGKDVRKIVAENNESEIGE